MPHLSEVHKCSVMLTQLIILETCIWHLRCIHCHTAADAAYLSLESLREERQQCDSHQFTSLVEDGPSLHAWQAAHVRHQQHTVAKPVSWPLIADDTMHACIGEVLGGHGPKG